MAKSKIAILIDPQDLRPPSDALFLDAFQRIAKDFDITADLLMSDEINRLQNYNGLFIRMLTSKDNDAYYWSYLAKLYSIKSVDTPLSIALGCDKYLQYKLCTLKNIRIPKTVIINKTTQLESLLQANYLHFPLVLKLSEESFSRGVFKVHHLQELREKVTELFSYEHKANLILQEYIYTPFDWRIGILAKKILYACRYYMVKDHWQILKYENNALIDEGNFDSVSITEIPEPVETFAHSLMDILDEGLYGVDIKMYQDKPHLIEINDNPSIYYDIEAKTEKDNLISTIIKYLLPELDLS